MHEPPHNRPAGGWEGGTPEGGGGCPRFGANRPSRGAVLLFSPSLTDETLTKVRRDFPGAGMFTPSRQSSTLGSPTAARTPAGLIIRRPSTASCASTTPTTVTSECRVRGVPNVPNPPARTDPARANSLYQPTWNRLLHPLAYFGTSGTPIGIIGNGPVRHIGNAASSALRERIDGTSGTNASAHQEQNHGTLGTHRNRDSPVSLTRLGTPKVRNSLTKRINS